MIKLCGFAASNYYNKVKFALLEKGVPFEEELIWGGKDPAFLEKSPLGKIPYIETGAVVVSESQAIVEYLETVYPEVPLIPRNPLKAAKIRELVMFTEFYLEWEARRIYPEAFFGGKVSDDVKQTVQRRLERAIAALWRLTTLDGFAVGKAFSLADVVLAVHLPVVGMATRQIYGKDMLADPRVKAYLGRLAERPSLQKVHADRKLSAAMMVERDQRS